MEDNAELESFRRQWREEVARRTKQPRPDRSLPKPSSAARLPPAHHEASERKEDEEEAETPYAGEIVSRVEQLHLGPGPGTADEDAFHPYPQEEPTSALEHFERAVQREAEGSLGDSLQHYRKAYRVWSTTCYGVDDGADVVSWIRVSTRPIGTSILPIYGRSPQRQPPSLRQRRQLSPRQRKQPAQHQSLSRRSLICLFRKQNRLSKIPLARPALSPESHPMWWSRF